jgi:Tol biopolymer transport system component
MSKMKTRSKKILIPLCLILLGVNACQSNIAGKISPPVTASTATSAVQGTGQVPNPESLSTTIVTQPVAITPTHAPTISLSPTFTPNPSQTRTPTISPTSTITPTPLPDNLILWNFTIEENELGMWCETIGKSSLADLWVNQLIQPVFRRTNLASIVYALRPTYENLPAGVEIIIRRPSTEQGTLPTSMEYCLSLKSRVSPAEYIIRFHMKLHITNPPGLTDPEGTKFIRFRVLPSLERASTQKLIAFSSHISGYSSEPIIGEQPLQLLGSNIMVLSADGSRITNLTKITPDEYYSGWDFPAWAPNGTYLAMVKMGGGVSYGIYTVSVDGSYLTQLTKEGMYPAWSPDGAWIAFFNYGIWIVNPNGSSLGLTELAHDTGQLFSWSPDSTRIVYESKNNIWVMKANDGSEKIQLTKNGGESPRWSPDGSKIAYISNNHIWVMNPDGSGQKQLEKSSIWSNHPEWSPDSKKIAFISEFIYTMNSDGSNLKRLPVGSVNQIKWSPDGNQILFSDLFDLYIINADGSNLKNFSLNDFSGEKEASWQP